MVAARTERSATAQRAFAAAAAAVTRHAPDARVAKLLAEATEMYTTPSDAAARLLAGLLCKEVARGAGDAFVKHAAQALLLPFVFGIRHRHCCALRPFVHAVCHELRPKVFLLSLTYNHSS